jgi:tellurite resistance protein
MIDPQTALVYKMVMVSAADSDMTDSELGRIGQIVSQLPVFSGFDTEQMTDIARDCAELLSQEDGLDDAIGQIRDALPERLRETAYVLACDIATADGRTNQEELRLLELLRHGLDVDRLAAAAIERAARARYSPI